MNHIDDTSMMRGLLNRLSEEADTVRTDAEITAQLMEAIAAIQTVTIHTRVAIAEAKAAAKAAVKRQPPVRGKAPAPAKAKASGFKMPQINQGQVLAALGLAAGVAAALSGMDFPDFDDIIDGSAPEPVEVPEPAKGVEYTAPPLGSDVWQTHAFPGMAAQADAGVAASNSGGQN